MRLQAGRVAKAVSDPTKVKVAEEAMLWGMVTTELLADEQVSLSHKHPTVLWRKH